jgi:glucose/arabinose dehydrogenase
LPPARTIGAIAAAVVVAACLVSDPAPSAAAVGDAGAPLALRGHKVAGGLDLPVGFTFDPRGRIWYVEKASGEVRILEPRSGRDRLFYRFSGVNAEGERGTLGIALHPDFPATPYVYVYVTRHAGDRPLQNQIVRLRDAGGTGRHPAIIFRSPTTSRTNHNGGRILFGPDDMLYAVVGDGGEDQATAQNLDDARGKVLRMTPAGDPAPGNPFAGTRVYAYGIRNSFGFDFDPQTDDMWETENGPECNDELNRIQAGENHGWGPSFDCGSMAPPLDTNRDGPSPVLPLSWFTPTIAPTGMAFCDGCGLGAAAEGTFLFGTNNTREIRQVTLNVARDGIDAVDTVLTEPQRVISLETAPSGRMYFSDIAGRIFRLAPA